MVSARPWHWKRRKRRVRGWRTEWAAALKLLGLAADTQPEAAAAQLDAIDQMREIAVKIHQLRHERIEKIESDIEVFRTGCCCPRGRCRN